MKKRFLCGVLAAAMLLSPASAAFSDISEPGVQQAAAVLGSLGIMEGEGGGRFNPNGQLTRAQFCKLAVTAMGVTDITAYQNYSVFPDVPANHWAAGYINAALKQTDIREKQIIRGFADGTFGPDKTISYGETCTMLLRMLGYTVEDVGPFWPADYIAKAEALNLNRGVQHYGASDIVKRGDAALLLLNTLQAAPKKGDKLLMNTVASSTVEDSILLATSDTDSELRLGQVRFYENGSIQIRSMATTIDSSLIGTRGTVLFDKVSTSKVRAFVPANGDSETITVKRAYADRIETADSKYKVPTKTPVVLNGELVEYGSAWPDLTPDYQLNIFYDAGRQIELISAAQSTSGADSFVYGTQGAVSIPSGFQILKNGVSVDLSKLKQYDLVTLNADSKAAIASDRRVTGSLTEASPSFGHPSSIKVLGSTYQISDRAASYFTNMKYGDRITLLLDTYGNVQAAYPASTISSENIGVFTSAAESGATVQLLTGGKATGALSSSNDQSLLGQLVRVSSDKDGKLTLSAYSGSKVSGAWDVGARTLGASKVAPNAKLYEVVADKAPAVSVSESDLPQSTVASSGIRYTVLDSAGSITAIVLSDVTGQGWQYGLANVESKKESGGSWDGQNITYETYTVTLRTIEDGKAVTKSYPVATQPSGISGSYIGIPKGMDALEGRLFYLPTKPLKAIDTVDLTSFDGADGVKTTSGYYKLPENIGVYVPSYERMVPLREAKVNFTSFALYGDGASDTKTVCMIVAK